jgi:acyl-coenzyme A synthetase/AMP-(fatty) acid ligase
MSFETIYSAACKHPSKSAIVHNGTAVSYAAFAGAIATTRSHLETRKLSEGDTVVVIIHNLRDCWVAVLALQALGLNTVCVHTASVVETLRLNNVAGIVTTELEFSKHQLDDWTGNGVITIPAPAYGDAELPAVPIFRENMKIGGHILYTSGTTGRYKKLFFGADLQQRRTEERIQSNDSYNSSIIFHCMNYGLWTAVGYRNPLVSWKLGGGIILDQRPEWYHYFLNSGMTNVTMVPDHVHQFLASLDDRILTMSARDFRLTIAGGFISQQTAAQLINHVTKNLNNFYGSTETNVAILHSVVTDLDELHWLACKDNRIVEIVDEAGDICPIDLEGQLRVRLRELDCFSYLDDLEASEKVFRSGYFYPGDMAVRRGDGRIRILGRNADVINFRGQKLAVAPIEHEIQNRLGAGNVCLFSGISNEGEDEILIAIESEHWPEQSDLDNLGHEFARFDQVRFAIVYPFPRTRTGFTKIDRIALRKLVFPVSTGKTLTP